ncbi:MAG: AgmX/PglI C-terminal domain-containing protein [Bdellovibrionales bacterium]|nr:AgmX/PglI C-terminal domain-containing protein [Bdellovibrionales bacterium]
MARVVVLIISTVLMSCATNIKKTSLQTHGYLTGKLKLEHKYPKLVFDNISVNLDRADGFFVIPFKEGQYTLEKIILVTEKKGTMTYSPMIKFNVKKGHITNLGYTKTQLVHKAEFYLKDRYKFISDVNHQKNDNEIIDFLKSNYPQIFAKVTTQEILYSLEAKDAPHFFGNQKEKYSETFEKYKNHIRFQINKNSNKIRGCYEKTKMKKTGKIIAEFSITGEGKVTNVDLKKKLYKELDDCLIKTISNIRFKAPPLKTNIVTRFPFVFSKERSK